MTEIIVALDVDTIRDGLGVAGFVMIGTPKEVSRYREWHDTLVRASLGEEESRAFMRAIRDATPDLP